MVIPRHHECDFCGKNLSGRRERCYIIKSKGSLGIRKHDVCSECMYEIERELASSQLWERTACACAGPNHYTILPTEKSIGNFNKKNRVSISHFVQFVIFPSSTIGVII